MKDESKTDWKRLEKMSEKEIDLSDIHELDSDFFKNAKVWVPPKKSPVSLRIDSDILDFFKHQGRGYQTKINAVLRAYMSAKVGHA